MMDKIFKEQIAHNMEVYGDDTLVKNQKAHTLSTDLNGIFTVLRS